MKTLLLFCSFFFSISIFSQTNVDFFENITTKPVDEIDAEITSLGYDLIKIDSAANFYVWQNKEKDGFTYQKGLFKVATQSKSNGQASVTLRPQIIFKFVTSDKEKYYSIQTSINNSNAYLKNSPVKTTSTISTQYKKDQVEITLQKEIFDDNSSLYTVIFIINNPDSNR